MPLLSPTSATVTQGDKPHKDDRGGVILESAVEHTVHTVCTAEAIGHSHRASRTVEDT